MISAQENCPFCQQQVVPDALVCRTCARDIAIPKPLVIERDKLLEKRAALKSDLETAKLRLEREKGRA